MLVHGLTCYVIAIMELQSAVSPACLFLSFCCPPSLSAPLHPTEVKLVSFSKLAIACAQPVASIPPRAVCARVFRLSDGVAYMSNCFSHERLLAASWPALGHGLTTFYQPISARALGGHLSQAGLFSPSRLQSRQRGALGSFRHTSGHIALRVPKKWYLAT